MAGRLKQAQVRFYVDADTLGLAHVLVRLRSDVTYPGNPGGITPNKRERPACPVRTTEVDDQIWIPQVAQQGWLIVTRDRKIQRRLAEQRAVVTAGARMVALTSDETLDTWKQLEVLLINWRRIERLLDEPGPLIYAARRSGLRRVPLPV